MSMLFGKFSNAKINVFRIKNIKKIKALKLNNSKLLYVMKKKTFIQPTSILKAMKTFTIVNSCCKL